MVITGSGAVEQAVTEKGHCRHFYSEWQGELDSEDSGIHFCVHWLHQTWLIHTIVLHRKEAPCTANICFFSPPCPCSAPVPDADKGDPSGNTCLLIPSSVHLIPENKFCTCNQDRPWSFLSEHEVGSHILKVYHPPKSDCRIQPCWE